MSHDDTGGFSLTNPADSASSGEAGEGGGIGTNTRTMTGNDLGGRSLVQASVQVVVQGVAGMRLPIGGRRVVITLRGLRVRVRGGEDGDRGSRDR
jgi:hypothetical protein